MTSYSFPRNVRICADSNFELELVQNKNENKTAQKL